MHTTSKLSIIAAAASLLAALLAFGAAADNPITYADEKTFFAAIDLSAAEGGSKPRLKYVEDVQNGIYYIEATFGDGFYVKIR
jgi:hypothetical protein